MDMLPYMLDFENKIIYGKSESTKDCSEVQTGFDNAMDQQR